MKREKQVQKTQIKYYKLYNKIESLDGIDISEKSKKLTQ